MVDVGFGSGVDGEEGAGREETAARADIDNGAASSLSHAREDESREDGWSENIDVDKVGDILVSELVEVFWVIV